MYKERTSVAPLVKRLIETINREEIIYSHWKSNIDLDQATAGKIDLDFLVDRKCLPQALAILSEMGFKAAVARWGANPPSIYHFYGLDPDTLQLIHVHLFSRVLTGESFVKSHLFPFEEMLLENVYYTEQIRVTAKPAELVLYTLRMFIKYGSLPDLLSLRRKSASIKEEVLWLQDGGDLTESLFLLDKYCPVIDEQLFVDCVTALRDDAPLFKRIGLARQVRKRLKVYAKHSSFMQFLAYVQLSWAELRRRLAGKPKNKVFRSGGAIIAIVGADATGKSTLVSETQRWLGNVFAVRTIHTGKPPSTWLTAPINIALLLVRKLGTGSQSAGYGEQSASIDPGLSQHKFKGLSSFPYALRSVTLAWDRQRLILNARRRVAEGELVVSDRYPSRTIGAMDSPRLVEESQKTGSIVAIYNRLAWLEKRLYEKIPPPDIALKLKVSLETAKKRNNQRDDKDGDAYLAARHRQSADWYMQGTNYVHSIDTDQTLEETIRNVKETIWEAL